MQKSWDQSFVTLRTSDIYFCDNSKVFFKMLLKTFFKTKKKANSANLDLFSSNRHSLLVIAKVCNPTRAIKRDLFGCITRHGSVSPDLNLAIGDFFATHRNVFRGDT